MTSSAPTENEKPGQVLDNTESHFFQEETQAQETGAKHLPVFPLNVTNLTKLISSATFDH